MFDLINEFYKKTSEMNIDWIAKGFLFRDMSVYTINHDTKLLGRIFEMLSEPILREIAAEHDYTLETPQQQNYYPDFILTPRGEESHRVAVDIKSTYRTYKSDGSLSPYKFTLGSYASFLRNGDKNIAYPYDQFDRHFVIGFVYDRNEEAQAAIPCTIKSIANAPEPYSNVDFFIQEKYKIAGFNTGSGNTENIGTQPFADIEDFKEGNGPFAEMGNDVFEFYWRNYPRYKATEKPYTGFRTFAQWVESNDDVDPNIKKKVRDYLNNYKESS
jgi:hypothetical protein